MITIPIEELRHIIEEFTTYFSEFNRIDDYLRKVKEEKIANLGINPLFPLEDDFLILGI